MNSPKRTVYPDRWLILSPDVFRTIADEPADDDGLYRLRLDERLVEPVDFDSLAQRIQKLAGTPGGSIHLIVDELDAQTMERLMPLARDDVDIQLHDWFESASDVLMSLGAPDQAVVDALRRAPGQSEHAALELASPADLSDELAMRYVEALPAWAKLAQEQWGEEFARHYPRYATTPAPLDDVIEARRSPVKPKAAVAAAVALAAGTIELLGKWSQGIPAQLREMQGRVIGGVGAQGGAGGIGAMHPLGAAGFHAAGEPAAPLDFDFKEAGMAAAVSFEFADQPVRLCRAYVAWSGEQLPDRLTLQFAAPSFDLELALSRDAWVRSGERQLLTVRLEDPVGALRAWLTHLHAVAGPPTLIAERD